MSLLLDIERAGRHIDADRELDFGMSFGYRPGDLI
jgi:hypothetical protein